MTEFVASLDGEGLAWLIVFLALGTGAGLYWSVRGLRHARLIGDTPTARVRSAPQGYVELKGTAQAMEGPPIVSPLTARRCVYWFYKIERRVQSGRRSYWKTVEKRRSDDLFHLVDDTGACVVDPVGAKVIAAETHTWYGRTRRPDRGPKAGGIVLGLGGQYRYHEALIRIGDPLYGLGEFSTRRAGAGDEADEVKLLLAEWKRDPERMAVFDVDGDGEVSPKEWRAARKVAIAQVRRERDAAETPPAVHVLHKDGSGRPYLLAALTEKQLRRRKLRKGFGGFTLFVASGAALLWVLQVRGVF